MGQHWVCVNKSKLGYRYMCYCRQVKVIQFNVLEVDVRTQVNVRNMCKCVHV